MKSPERSDAEMKRRSLVRPSDFWVQAVAAGIFTITTATHDGEVVRIARTEQSAREKESDASPPPAERRELNPEDLKLLDDIDADVKQALEQCSSCANLFAIPVVLSKLPMTEPVTIDKLRESSNGTVTPELFASVNRSLTILEVHPHLSHHASIRAERQLNALGVMDARRALLLQLLSVCRKQMIVQESGQHSVTVKR